MQAMTGRERTANILGREPVDRIAVFEHFWGDTRKVWTEGGHIKEDENLPDHFGFDMQQCNPFKMVIDLDFEPEILEETEETKLVKDGNGARLRKRPNSGSYHLALK